MAAGVEKYFQIARCFRDEDPRADRQPEHTQLDLEMSFVEEDDVLGLIEELYTALVETVTPDKRILRPFPRLTYADSMASYGTDKPDLRFGMKMVDLSDIAANTDFRVFTSAVESGGTVKGFSAPGCASYSRRQTDEMIDFVKAWGAERTGHDSPDWRRLNRRSDRRPGALGGRRDSCRSTRSRR